MSTEADASIIKLGEVLKKYYWDRLTARSPDATTPFFDLANYVTEAWKARLDKREECAYAGTKLLQSVLVGTSRRFTYQVQEANDLFTMGMRVAEHLWNVLDASGGDNYSFKAEVHRIEDLLSDMMAQVVTS